MQRIPEPELMEDDLQALAYAQADFEAPHRLCLELLCQSCPDLPSSGTALDLGCGPADITLRFARTFPDWQVEGVEGATAMLRYGHQAVAQAGLQDRVRLIQAHLPTPQLPQTRYDLVFSNSLLHHLADPMVLWGTVNHWTLPGAPVFVMDLMRPKSREHAQQLVKDYAADEPDVLRQDFCNSLLAAYEPEEVRGQLVQAGLEHLQVRVVSDRHLIVWGKR